MIPVQPPNAKAHDLGPRTVGSLTEPGTSAPLDSSADSRRRPPESASKTVLLTWAYDEYCRLEEEGAPPDVRAFCARFPTCRSTLLRMLDVAEFIGEHPEYLAAPTSADKSVPWPVEGERRGDWTIVRELGRGTFARVFLATEASTGDRPVVVKFSARDDAEARTLGRLSHANVVPILSARRDESTGLTVVCMPYLGSATLEDVRDRVAPAPAESRPRGAAIFLDVLRACAQPEDPPAAPADPRLQRGSFADGVIHLAIQLAEALAFLHAQGVCHRDLKPSNVLLDFRGKPLLLDFNLSAHERDSGPVGGTLGYMPPEQLRAFLGEGNELVYGRADLFALSVIVWELLTGEHPFGPLPPNLKGRPLAHYLLERIPNGVSSLKRLCPDLEKPVAVVLERCLAADPANRPRDAAELAVELKRQFAPLRRTRRWLVARPRLTLTALTLFALAAAAAGSAWAVIPPYSAREYQAGKTAYRAGRYDDAEQHFDQALSREPGNLRWHHARGWARLKAISSLPDDQARDKMDQAWNDLMYGRGGIIDNSISEAIAYLQIRQGNPAAALLLYAALAKSGPLSAAQLNNRAFCCLQLAAGPNCAKLLALAEADLETAGAMTPNCQAIYYNRATIVHKRGGVSQRSLNDIERAVQLGPATYALYRDAALMYGRAADLRRAPVMLDAPIATALFFEARSRRIERALYYARESIALGQPYPRQFLAFKHFLPPTKLDELLAMKPPPVVAPIELRLIEPAGELD